MRFAALFLLGSVLHGEMQSVVLQFNPINCQKSCQDLLARNFRRISGVQDVQISPQQGLVRLQYAPNALFSFPAINTAVRTVGPNLEWIQMTIRGTIEVNGHQAFISSVGDGNRFQLIAPGSATPQGFSVEYNIASHNLNPAQLSMLTDLAKKKEIVIVTGTLFQPERAPPYNLIMLTVKADEKKES